MAIQQKLTTAQINTFNGDTGDILALDANGDLILDSAELKMGTANQLQMTVNGTVAYLMLSNVDSFRIRDVNNSTDRFTFSRQTGVLTVSGGVVCGAVSTANGGINGFGLITGNSLNVGTGNITAGAITGNSLNVGTGGITGGTATLNGIAIGDGVLNVTGGSVSMGSLSLNDGGGNVAVGPDIKINAQGLISTDSNMFLNIDADNNGSGSFVVKKGGYTSSATSILTVDINGNLTAIGNVTAYSDESLKENITPIYNAVDKVKSINGVYFTRKDQEDKKRQVGVIAQQIEETLPEVVTTHEDGIKSVAYGNVVGLLIEAIKEQQKEIDELKKLVSK